MNLTQETTLDEALKLASAGGLIQALIWQVKVASDLGVSPESLNDMTFEEFAGHVKRLGLDKE